MNHSLSIDGRIKSEFEFHAVGAIKGSRTSSIPDSKTDDAHGVTAHGVMIKDLQWTFDESPGFKNLLQLEIVPDN